MSTAQPDDELQTLRSYVLLGPDGDMVRELQNSEAKQRIQALLSQWLRMENIVVLLGAGASHGQGGPTMAMLEEFVLTELESLCVAHAPLFPCLSLVRRRRALPATKKTAFSFERWLTFLTNLEHVGTSPDSPASKVSFFGLNASGDPEETEVTASALTALLKVIQYLVLLRCSLTLPELTTAAQGHHAFVAKLIARDPALGRVHLFTTNYDTLIEQALDALAVRYTDGFAGTIERRFDLATYGLDMYYPGEVAEGRVRRYDKFLHLYKIHGSINWVRQPSGTVVQVPSVTPRPWATWQQLELTQKLSSLASLPELPMAVLPTENKFVETLGMPYALLFRMLHQRLQVPQTFFLLVGYGFSDPHVNSIINDALTNPSLVLLVVDPFASAQLTQRITQYQQSGERAFLLTGNNPPGAVPTYATFDDFAQRLLPHVKWIDDFVRLRKTEQTLRTTALNEGASP